MSEHIELAIKALSKMRGDVRENLYRAEIEFLRSKKPVDSLYGDTGKTLSEIIAQYRESIEKINTAIRYLEVLTN